jgi:hypothetical protein
MENMNNLKIFFLSATLISGCVNNSDSSSDGESTFKFYGPIYQGVIGRTSRAQIYDTIAPVQLSYEVVDGKVRGAIRTGNYRAKWEDKIKLVTGYFEGYSIELKQPDALMLRAGFNLKDSIWIVVFGGDNSHHYSSSIYGGIDPPEDIGFEAVK